MLKLQVEIDVDSNILDEINVDGKTYYKLNEYADIDKEIKKSVVDDITAKLYRDWNGDFKKIVKDFLIDNKEAIIELASVKVAKSVIHSKEVKELKDNV